MEPAPAPACLLAGPATTRGEARRELQTGATVALPVGTFFHRHHPARTTLPQRGSLHLRDILYDGVTNVKYGQ